MGFDFAEWKGRVRRVVHDTLAFDAMYLDPSLAAPVNLRVRWHYKQAPIGDIENEGYPMYLDLVEKVIFDKAELVTKGITVQRGGRITLTAKGFTGTLIVDTQVEDDDGPVEESWRVGKALKDGGLSS